MKNDQIILAVMISTALTFGHSSVHAEAEDAGVKSFHSVDIQDAATSPAPVAASPAPAIEAAIGTSSAGSSSRVSAQGLAQVSAKGLARSAAVEGSPGLRAIVARHAAAQGVPFALADAVVRVESRYNPRASNKGNYGLMQIRHQTARGLGYGGPAAGLLDAETNAKYGMMYLAQAYRMARGDTCRTVMKYQSGHMATQLSSANRAYCAKVRTHVASL